MVPSKTVILAAALATAVVAVPSNGAPSQWTQSDEANLIKAREPMLPPPGGFKFQWGGSYRPQILAGLRREADDDEALPRRMFIPPGGPVRVQRWGLATGVAGQRREPVEYHEQELETRELPPRPFGYRYSNIRYGDMNRLHMIRPTPIAARDPDHGDLEEREHYSNGRFDTSRGPLPAYITPNVRELVKARGMPFEGFRNGPPVGWASPWWKGKPAGMARDVHEEELEAREPIMMNLDAPRPPVGWKSPWFHGRPVGALRLREDEELETRSYDMDELD